MVSLTLHLDVEGLVVKRTLAICLIRDVRMHHHY
jgi:hypothetical protein